MDNSVYNYQQNFVEVENVFIKCCFPSMGRKSYHFLAASKKNENSTHKEKKVYKSNFGFVMKTSFSLDLLLDGEPSYSHQGKPVQSWVKIIQG